MDIGCGEGQFFSLNVPLKPFVNDEQFTEIFRSVMTKVREQYQPDAVVLQCGADSLAGDKLGTHNTTIRGHGDCVKFIKSW
jgi:histone deacetylase 1/2